MGENEPDIVFSGLFQQVFYVLIKVIVGFIDVDKGRRPAINR
jgi:hypothetical protein